MPVAITAVAVGTSAGRRLFLACDPCSCLIIYCSQHGFNRCILKSQLIFHM